MKNLLVAIELDTGCNAPFAPSLLAAAAAAADTFGSYVEVIAIQPPLPSALLVGEMDMGADAFRPCTAAEAYAAFEAGAGALSKSAAFTWGGLLTPASLGGHARPFDLSIMARRGVLGDAPARDALEHALFESGRPVLLISGPAPSVSGTVVVSWTDTVETARAMTAALPLLQRASAVYLVSVQNDREPPPSAERAARALMRHGVPAQCTLLPERGARGETILAFAKKLDADLLIKGAYTQTRLRRLIFGGTTDYILSHCPMPLLIAH